MNGVEQTQQSITGIELSVGTLSHVYEEGNVVVYGVKWVMVN